AIALRPADGHALREGGRYAAVATSAVRSVAGEPLTAAASFAALRDASARPTDALLGEAWDRYEPVLASLATEGTPRESVAALAVFRTQTITDELALVRTALWADDAPVPVIDSVISGE